MICFSIEGFSVRNVKILILQFASMFTIFDEFVPNVNYDESSNVLHVYAGLKAFKTK